VLRPQVASGLQRLRTARPRPIVHGDLKCAKVLVEDDGDGAVIADFGLARAVREAGGGCAGAASDGGAASAAQRGRAARIVYISPPEVLADPRAPRGPPVDVYAKGVVLYEMTTGRAAFVGMRQHEVVSSVLAGGRPSIPRGVRREVTALIEDCWAQATADRPTAELVVARLNVVIRQLAVADTLRTTTVTADSL
jgi:serine/threonine protein kinase